jgi:hypothetical protein
MEKRERKRSSLINQRENQFQPKFPIPSKGEMSQPPFREEGVGKDDSSQFLGTDLTAL